MAKKSSSSMLPILILVMVAVGIALAVSNPTPHEFDSFVKRRYPVTSLIHRRTAVSLTGQKDFFFFSIHGVQTLQHRRHYVGAMGHFWALDES